MKSKYQKALDEMAGRYERVFKVPAVVGGLPTMDFVYKVCKQYIDLESKEKEAKPEAWKECEKCAYKNFVNDVDRIITKHNTKYNEKKT